jgi:hypothetical protein
MSELLIHIGYHKTGTSWLQKELFISSNEVFEPLTNRKDTGKSDLSIHFILDEERNQLSPYDFNKTKIKTNFAQNAFKKNADGKVFVISNERLSGHIFSGGFDSKLIAHRIFNSFPNAKIFISVRDQKALICSWYFQYLSAGGVKKLSIYLHQKDLRRPYFSPAHLKYTDLIEEYYSLFKKENVLVLPYELLAQRPEEYMLRLGDFLGRKINIDNSRFDVFHNKKKNYFVLHKFRWLNYFISSNATNNFSSLKSTYSKLLAKKIQNLLIHLIPDRLSIKTKKEHQIYTEQLFRDTYSDSNKKLSKLIDIDLFQFGYYK